MCMFRTHLVPGLTSKTNVFSYRKYGSIVYQVISCKYDITHVSFLIEDKTGLCIYAYLYVVYI